MQKQKILMRLDETPTISSVFSSTSIRTTYIQRQSPIQQLISRKETIWRSYEYVQHYLWLLRYGIIVDEGAEKKVCIKELQPNYPSNLVNNEAQKITSTFNEIIDDIITIIMPADYEDIAKDKLRIFVKNRCRFVKIGK